LKNHTDLHLSEPILYYIFLANHEYPIGNEPCLRQHVSSSSNSFSLPRLWDDGSNWVDYEMKAKTAMGVKGLIRHVDGMAVRPKAFALESNVPVSKPKTPAIDDEIDAKERRMEDYEQKEYLAQHVMLLMLSPRLTGIIKGKTACEMWTAIKADATTKSQLHKVLS
jgi:hypothetical protein